MSIPLLQEMVRGARRDIADARDDIAGDTGGDSLADALDKLCDVLDTILIAEHTHFLGINAIRTYRSKVDDDDR